MRRVIALQEAGLLDRLRNAELAVRNGQSMEEARSKLMQTSCELSLDKWITQDAKMKLLKDYIRQLYHRHDPVLITGPTGTGKELLARALEKEGSPFIAVNCGGLSRDLVPSIFFGSIKGAYTGSVETREGLLVAAKEGIIFLDEIAELPLELQATLLRAIQEGEVYKIGSTTPSKIHCRFVCATRHDLESLVERNLFREDLYGRLFIHHLKVTGLKDRQEDIPLIAASPAESLSWNEPIAQEFYPTIFKYNVRGIQAYIARMKTKNNYE